MKRWLLILLPLLGIGAYVVAQQADAARTIFKRADKNGDGQVTRDEVPDAQTFARFDLNEDGIITLQEGREAMVKELKRKRGQPGEPAPSAAPVKLAGPVIMKGDALGVGRRVPDVLITTIDGEESTLHRVLSPHGIIVAMTSSTCPVSNRYMPTLAALHKGGVSVLLVNPFASETKEQITTAHREAGLTAPCVHDTDKAVASALGARSTTEVFLIDASGTLRYRGAIDDQFGTDYNLDAPRANYLRDAVSAVLAHTRVPITATSAPGCELDLANASAVGKTEVTYHRDVARILQAHCTECHRQDGVAPFALDDITEVKDRAKTIKRVLSDGTMPPWFAALAPGAQGSPWANDCSLSSRDKADLLAWIDSAERPLGDPAHAPQPITYAAGWTIGEPDLVVALPQPVSIKATGFMPYQFVVAETTLTEDKWVQGYEIVPSDRSVVHHVIVNVHKAGAKLRDREEGSDGYWAAYVPGNTMQVYPPGFARKLPAGARVSFQIHYTPNGKATQDQLKMGLIFAKTAPRYEVRTLAVPKRPLNIPPGESNHIETTTKPAPFDLNVMALMAHMHVRGKAFRFEVTHADGRSETLLDIPRYDFNWQLRYDYAQPKLIPRGSQLTITAAFDNSPANKANPDPSATVHWGPQTVDEMMIGYIEIFTPLPAPTTAGL
jgi:peroxiredoxin